MLLSVWFGTSTTPAVTPVVTSPLLSLAAVATGEFWMVRAYPTGVAKVST